MSKGLQREIGRRRVLSVLHPYVYKDADLHPSHPRVILSMEHGDAEAAYWS